MNADNKIETGGPAYPCKGIITLDGVLYEGMSLRTYAAIHLGVPQSEHDWINDMIRESQRNELAKAAMQGLIPMIRNESDSTNLISVATLLADAMLAERENKS